LETKLIKKPVVNLIPWLDPYIMGYKDRDRYREQKYNNLIFDRSGNATSTILLNGRIIGTWDINDTFVKIFLFDKISDDIIKELYTKAMNIGTFLSGKKLQIKLCKTMNSLLERTAGSFMTPLKNS